MAQLTLTQKTLLLVECLPFPFFVLALIFCLTILDDITGAPLSIFLILFLGFVTLIVGWTALQRIRDVLSGVLLIQDDFLENAWRSRGSSRPNPFYGRFEQLGAMRLRSNAWTQAQSRARYRVYYSPASKIVWSLEKLP